MDSMDTPLISEKNVEHIAALARIPVSGQEKQSLARGFNITMKVVDELFAVDVSGVEPTHQVTGMEDVMRDDTLQPERTFTQKQALANAPRSHDGCFVVDRVLNIE